MTSFTTKKNGVGSYHVATFNSGGWEIPTPTRAITDQEIEKAMELEGINKIHTFPHPIAELGFKLHRKTRAGLDLISFLHQYCVCQE